METLRIVGNVFGQVRPLTPGDVARIMGGLRSSPQHTGTPDPARRAVTGQQQGEAASDVGRPGAGRLGSEFLGPGESLQRTLPVIPTVEPGRHTGY
jgi:hypothetical protein